MKTEISTVTTKGQLVIPSKLRLKYSIKEGTRVAFLEQENRLVLHPSHQSSSAVSAAPSEASRLH